MPATRAPSCLLRLYNARQPSIEPMSEALVVVAWASRRLAPTNLRLAGFLTGLTSGSAAALVGALYGREPTATFLASCYNSWILAAGPIGRAAGPGQLRW